MALKRVTAPGTLPLTLAEAKIHVHEEGSDQDDLIQLFIQAAVDHVDGPNGFLGRALIDQTWDYFLEEHPVCAIDLPLPPLIEVIGVFAIAGNGTETEWPAENYRVDNASEPGRIVTATAWPSPTYGSWYATARVRYRAGYVDTQDIPQAAVPFPIRAAILLHVGDLYRTRETSVIGEKLAALPWAAEQLLRPHRFYTSMS